MLGFLIIAISWLPLTCWPSHSEAALSLLGRGFDRGQSNAALTAEAAQTSVPFFQFRSAGVQNWPSRVALDIFAFANPGMAELPGSNNHFAADLSSNGLQNTWQFAFRTALAPRAPNLP